VNFGSPQPGSYGPSTQGLHRYGPPLLGQCDGALPIQGKLGMVLCGSATPSQERLSRALSFRARRTRFELAGVLTHNMVRCHVGHCTSRTIVPRLRLTRRSRSPKYARWQRCCLFSSCHHWCISFAPSTGRASSNTFVKGHIWTTRDNTV
jgi:hypothetical protein